MKSGELLLPNEVLGEAGDRFSIDSSLAKHLSLLIHEERITCHEGRLLTVFHPLRTAQQKAEAGKGFSGVDMEAATVAAVCEKQGIPFGCLKVVFDPVEMELPITDRGRLDKKAFLKLPTLLKNHLACQRNLARVLGRLLTSSSSITP